MDIFEKHNADEKSIGFDFQFYVFLNLLFDIEEGEIVSYELYDDVSIEKTNQYNFFQVKHTINNEEKKKYLTNKDYDLIHTLAMWLEFDENEHVIDKTNFYYVTTKIDNGNDLVAAINKYRESKNDENFNAVMSVIEKNKNETKNEDLKGLFNYILGYSREILKKFFCKIDFKFCESDIISIIKRKIRTKYVNQNKVDSVFNELYGYIKQMYFENVILKKKTSISFETFSNIFNNVAEHNRTTCLTVRKFNDALPENLDSQKFMKELIEIGDVTSQSEKEDYTMQKLTVINNFQKWIDDGVLLQSDKDDFDDVAIAYWKGIHKNSHRQCTNDYDAANDVLFEMRKKEFILKDLNLDTRFCHGELYLLSDEEKIGWLKKWEEKYKK